MKKICYLLVALMTIGMMSCQKSEIAEQGTAGKGHIALGVSLSGGMQDLILKSPSQSATGENVYGGYEYGDKIPDQVFLVWASWDNETCGGNKLFVIDARKDVSITNPALDMEMYYGKNNVTFKAFGISTCSQYIKDYLTNVYHGSFPDISVVPGPLDEKGNEDFEKYLTTWRDFVAPINEDFENYIPCFQKSRYEFIGRKSVTVTAINSSEKEAVNTISDIVLYRMISQVNFDFSQVLEDITKYPLYSWDFTLESVKKVKDLSVDKYLNINDNTLVEDLRNCTLLSEGVINETANFDAAFATKDVKTNICHVKITKDGVKTENQEFFRNMSELVGSTDPRYACVHSTWTDDNSYGAIRLSYTLHTPSGDITGVIENIVGEGATAVDSEILNLFILNTCYSIDFSINEAIYTDDALNGKFQLVFKGLIGKKGTVSISDTGNSVIE